jgi:hypothetical protein
MPLRSNFNLDPLRTRKRQADLKARTDPFSALTRSWFIRVHLGLRVLRNHGWNVRLEKILGMRQRRLRLLLLENKTMTSATMKMTNKPRFPMLAEEVDGLLLPLPRVDQILAMAKETVTGTSKSWV